MVGWLGGISLQYSFAQHFKLLSARKGYLADPTHGHPPLSQKSALEIDEEEKKQSDKPSD